MTVRYRGAAKTAVGILVVAGVSWASLLVWAPWLGGYLVHSDPPVRADIVLVLGGDYRGTRLLTAAELAWQGYAPAVLVSGEGEIYGQHESDLAVNFALQHGFEERLFIKFKYPAESTREEVRAIVAELRRRRLKHVLLVTSSYHTRRAGIIFRQEGPEIECHVIASVDRYFQPNGWWKSREGRKTFLLEWTKTLANFAGL